MNPYNTSVIIFTLIIHTASTYRVLIYNPAFAHSHMNFMTTISELLTEAGHEVVSVLLVQIIYIVIFIKTEIRPLLDKNLKYTHNSKVRMLEYPSSVEVNDMLVGFYFQLINILI